MFSMFRSLRWRLQAWHALVLCLVIVVFGSMLHWEMVRAHWDRVDDELLGAARILEGSMNAVPSTVLEALAKDVISRSGPRKRQPPTLNRPRRESMGNLPLAGPPKLEPSRPRMSTEWTFPKVTGEVHSDWTQSEWEASIELPPQLPEHLGRFEGPAYFVIWRSDGTVLKDSKVPSQSPFPTYPISEAIDRDRYARQQRGIFREVFIRGPHETTICVGRSAAGEQLKVASMTWTIVLAGLSVLGVGLLGGWWSSKRAIEPIERMSRTAQRVSGNSLSERIELAGFDSELAGLGASLNTMLDRLGHSFEQQRQFTADASHEFRTPLSVILASSELALSKPRSPEEYREHLGKCQRAAIRMQELGDSMLTLARLDANPMLDLQNVNVAALLEEAIDSIRPLLERNSLQLESDLQPCELQGNRSMLRQSIDNLLANAIKYNQPNGQVAVRCKQVGQSIEIEIADSGIGIPADAIPKLFDRFFRVEESRSRIVGGTGLGLSIVKQIIVCHSGSISVTSVVDKGSTFSISLPSRN
jgi:two-component system, OmpR family, sensor kinase